MKKILIICTVAFAFCFSAYGQKQSNKQSSTKVSSPFNWPKIDESKLGVCKPITKEQMEKIEKASAILFKEYEKINEYSESMEFVYTDAMKYAPYILDFISIERLCCPSYSFFIKFTADSKKVSLIVGGSSKIKELAKEYTKE